MIPLTLMYKKDGVTQRVRVRHYAVPKVGEKVIPPDEDTALTVVTVEHDLRFDCSNNIWVLLD